MHTGCSVRRVGLPAARERGGRSCFWCRGEENEMGLALRWLALRGAPAVAVSFVGALVLAGAAEAATTAISTDPFTQATCHASSTTNHQTEVEPDTFSNSATIVAAYQVGRVFDGGACAVGFATSTN